MRNFLSFSFFLLPKTFKKSGSYPHSSAAAPIRISMNVESQEEALVQVLAETGLPYLGSTANQRAEAFAPYRAPACCCLCWPESWRGARAKTKVCFEIMGTLNSAGANHCGWGFFQISRLLQTPKLPSATRGLGVKYISLGNPLSAHPFLLSWSWERNSGEVGRALITAKVIGSCQSLAAQVALSVICFSRESWACCCCGSGCKGQELAGKNNQNLQACCFGQPVATEVGILALGGYRGLRQHHVKAVT